ncbi:cyclic nucleotide-binding domain-containing protein [Chloroflexota bacterium]
MVSRKGQGAFQAENYMKTYGKSEVVFRQNMPGKEMYIVYSGKIDIVLEGSEGKTTVLATLEPGQFFGEIALVDGDFRSASAVAIENGTRLLVLDRARLIELFGQQPEIALTIIQTLCRRLRDTNTALAQAKDRQKE